ncbi:transcriptional regulator, AraC family [Pseudoxanthomonas sp. GM95]|uniref:AraC family transcriptional regulator n=1 Tax=Pseudoxanthomonas sp. GM95 TaxID=1881043 RepID=UPI0008BC22EF|nr:AraC family transcriptional regulator [Pseudoxanthomonas sp. GM95]SEL67674.1 transcriptional regulator, AraC family [Pseudoxanthomonas sp. GM95]
MKPGSQHDYQQRIARVLTRVEQAVDAGEELPDLAKLAALSHFSPYHFHRIYRALTGETLGRSLGRLRLARALHLLADEGRSITEVALAAGYGSSQGFARVLRDALDTTPSALREDGKALAAARTRLLQPAAIADHSEAPLQVSVVSLEPFEVIALRTVGQYDDLDQVYTRLFDWVAQAGFLDRLDGLFGIAGNDLRDTPPAEVVFTSALGVPGVVPPAPMQQLKLEGGRYASLRHIGSFLGLEDSTDRLLAQWLPDSGEALRDAPILYAYLDDPEHVPEPLLRTDILVPLA